VPGDLWHMTTSHLETLFSPTQTDRALKRNFWLEVFKRIDTTEKIKPSLIYEDLCTYTHWYNNILGQPFRLAWLLKTSDNISELIESHNLLALQKMREILLLDSSKENKPDHKVIDAQIRIFETLSNLQNLKP